jgi:hypothetical protein
VGQRIAVALCRGVDAASGADWRSSVVHFAAKRQRCPGGPQLTFPAHIHSTASGPSANAIGRATQGELGPFLLTLPLSDATLARIRPGAYGGLLRPSVSRRPWNAMCSRSGPDAQCSVMSTKRHPSLQFPRATALPRPCSLPLSPSIGSRVAGDSFDSLYPPSFVWARALDSPPPRVVFFLAFLSP